MDEGEMLKESIDAAKEAKENIKTTTKTFKSICKGLKGAAMDAANEALKQAKIELELKLDCTKRLAEVLPLMIAVDVELEALKVAYTTAMTPVELAQQEVDKTKDVYEKAKKTYEDYRQMLVWEGKEIPESSAEKTAVETAKSAFDTANTGLQQARDALKVVKDPMDDCQKQSNMYHKEVAKLRLQLDPTAIPKKLAEIKEKAMSMTQSATNEVQATATTAATQTTTQEPQVEEQKEEESVDELTEEELNECQEQADALKAAKEEEISSLDPKYEQLSAERLIIESGFAVLQGLLIPLPQTASLPAAVGAAAPNPAFNMAVAGSIGAIALFILCEIKAAFLRWSALCEELEADPDPAFTSTTMAQIQTYTASIPSASATGASYLAAIIPQIS